MDGGHPLVEPVDEDGAGFLQQSAHGGGAGIETLGDAHDALVDFLVQRGRAAVEFADQAVAALLHDGADPVEAAVQALAQRCLDGFGRAAQMAGALFEPFHDHGEGILDRDKLCAGIDGDIVAEGLGPIGHLLAEAFGLAVDVADDRGARFLDHVAQGLNPLGEVVCHLADGVVEPAGDAGDALVERREKGAVGFLRQRAQDAGALVERGADGGVAVVETGEQGILCACHLGLVGGDAIGEAGGQIAGPGVDVADQAAALFLQPADEADGFRLQRLVEAADPVGQKAGDGVDALVEPVDQAVTAVGNEAFDGLAALV